MLVVQWSAMRCDIVERGAATWAVVVGMAAVTTTES